MAQGRTVARPAVRGFCQRPLVYTVMSVYAVASIGLMASHRVGLTSEHAILLVLVGAALLVRARPLVWDWLPFLFVAVMFEDLSAVSGAVAGSLHVVGPIVLEKTLLGGAVAATWLQQHARILPGSGLVGLVLVAEYLAHFIAPLLAGYWLWARHRQRFATFVGAYVLAMSLGFVIYLLFPETPPWLAAREGHLPHVDRIVVHTLQQLGGLGNAYSGADPEPNAAMPSLHVTIPVIIAAMIVSVRGWRSRLSWAALLYPLTISFAVLYLGEHYLADAIVGAALGVVAFVLADRLVGRGRRWSMRAPLAARVFQCSQPPPDRVGSRAPGCAEAT